MKPGDNFDELEGSPSNSPFKSKSFTFLNDEIQFEFIKFVEERPIIWDDRHPEYFDSDKRWNIWAEAQRVFNITPYKAKVKWRNVRDKYMRDTKLNLPTNWKFYSSMTFLAKNPSIRKASEFIPKSKKPFRNGKFTKSKRSKKELYYGLTDIKQEPICQSSSDDKDQEEMLMKLSNALDPEKNSSDGMGNLLKQIRFDNSKILKYTYNSDTIPSSSIVSFDSEHRNLIDKTTVDPYTMKPTSSPCILLNNCSSDGALFKLGMSSLRLPSSNQSLKTHNAKLMRLTSNDSNQKNSRPNHFCGATDAAIDLALKKTPEMYEDEEKMFVSLAADLKALPLDLRIQAKISVLSTIKDYNELAKTRYHQTTLDKDHCFL